MSPVRHRRMWESKWLSKTQHTGSTRWVKWRVWCICTLSLGVWTMQTNDSMPGALIFTMKNPSLLVFTSLSLSKFLVKAEGPSSECRPLFSACILFTAGRLSGNNWWDWENQATGFVGRKCIKSHNVCFFFLSCSFSCLSLLIAISCHSAKDPSSWGCCSCHKQGAEKSSVPV